MKSILIAQSGGPSAVINSTLKGIIDGCRSYPQIFGKIYGGWHGIEGVLKEELIDIGSQDDKEIKLLGITPGAGAIGTCRYKLKEENPADFERVLNVFREHNIGYFFYIGGNDSMDTANKISILAKEKGLEIVSVGAPKTIDNDVGDSEFKLIDHTPGYGSTARYWANYIRNLEEENRGSSPADPVMVVQAMGRKIGFIPAASRLADPEREMPLQIYMSESGVNLHELGENVIDCLRKRGRCIVVVSEGFDVGKIGDVKDSFGHISFGSSKLSVAQVVTNYLNSIDLPVPGKARFQIPGTDQRHAAIYASTVDLDEAYRVGLKCTQIAKEDGSGWMATILREKGDTYRVKYDKVPLEKVANSERFFPEKWIKKSGYDVTDDFIKYAMPLIGEVWPDIPLHCGLPRFARFKKIFVQKKLDEYIPVTYRK
jgi:ATP-dependent phosphofructokinase / diphosphate-dependent phosphofructokinase